MELFNLSSRRSSLFSCTSEPPSFFFVCVTCEVHGTAPGRTVNYDLHIKSLKFGRLTILRGDLIWRAINHQPSGKPQQKKKKTFQIVCFLTFCHLFFHHLISIHYISLPFQLCIEGLFCGSQLHRSWNLIYQSFPKQKGRVLIDWWMDWLNDWMTNWLRTLRCSENYCSPYPASHFSWKHQKNTRNYAELFKTGDNSRLWGTYRPSFGKPTLLTR